MTASLRGTGTRRVRVQELLAIAYEADGNYRLLRPDFVFFARLGDGSIAADIVDPHGTHFSDALPKLQALARYAEEHPAAYRRIEAIADVGDKLRVIDLTDPDVRAVVLSATGALELYQGTYAGYYL